MKRSGGKKNFAFVLPAAPLFRALALLAALSVLSPLTAGAEEIGRQEREQTYKNLEIFSNVLSIIQENYVEEIDTDKAMEGAINGLLRSLDPHSTYLTPQNFEDLQDQTQGSFTGIGIEITVRDGKLTVVSPIEGTPAFKAGIKANDTIVKIEDQWTRDMSTIEAVKQLRGPKGSEITFSIWRKEWDDFKEITLVRDVIPVQSVHSLFLDNDIAYTRISNFQRHTTRDYRKALQQLQEQHAIAGIILDLRNNPGGLLDQAVSITDVFIDEGLIVYTKGRREDQNMVFKAHEEKSHTAVPVIVLVNEGSASASEIVAGAIQDQQRGLILGTQTFGKGSVQTIVPLQDGAGLRMTTARYFTPAGRSIQVKGITPDIEVPYIPYDPSAGAEKKKTSTREADLRNHFLNSDTSGKMAPNRQSQSSQTPNTVPEKQKSLTPPSQEKGQNGEEEIAARLKHDNQVRMALSILKGINIISTGTQSQQQQ
ncbi:MAG: S41 family peptidase [Desulfopila sp.]